jgi:type II secretory pathway pseudopilin PulG
VLVITGTVVLVLFGIVAAIAIPNILESKTAANEAAAISSCRVVSSAQELHHARFDRYATLEELAGNMFIDSILAGGRKSGYDFELAVAEDGQSWSMSVWPVTPGTTGDRSFYIDESGIVRYDIFVSEDDMPADSTSTPLGGW